MFRPPAFIRLFLTIVAAVVVLGTMDDMIFYAYPSAVAVLFFFDFLGFIFGCGIFGISRFRYFSFSVGIFVIVALARPTRLAYLHDLCGNLPE